MKLLIFVQYEYAGSYLNVLFSVLVKWLMVMSWQFHKSIGNWAWRRPYMHSQNFLGEGQSGQKWSKINLKSLKTPNFKLFWRGKPNRFCWEQISGLGWSGPLHPTCRYGVDDSNHECKLAQNSQDSWKLWHDAFIINIFHSFSWNSFFKLIFGLLRYCKMFIIFLVA